MVARGWQWRRLSDLDLNHRREGWGSGGTQMMVVTAFISRYESREGGDGGTQMVVAFRSRLD
jgi:hypothetical protein